MERWCGSPVGCCPGLPSRETSSISRQSPAAAPSGHWSTAAFRDSPRGHSLPRLFTSSDWAGRRRQSWAIPAWHGISLMHSVCSGARCEPGCNVSEVLLTPILLPSLSFLRGQIYVSVSPPTPAPSFILHTHFPQYISCMYHSVLGSASQFSSVQSLSRVQLLSFCLGICFSEDPNWSR